LNRRITIKILALDIETLYLTAGVWGVWGVNVGLEQLFDNGKVLCWAAKWIGKRDMFYGEHRDLDFLQRIHALLDEADAVLTYNGKRFDVPMLNREFLKAGMSPPSPYKQIDLLETMKKQFKFPSNKLQHVSSELGIGSKTKHEGFSLWTKCEAGDPKAWELMERYNKQDVRLLEKLYNKTKAWTVGHPNQNTHGKNGVCPVCGGKHLQSRGTYKTATGIYPRLQCVSCGKWSRGRFTLVEKTIRPNILVEAAI